MAHVRFAIGGHASLLMTTTKRRAVSLLEVALKKLGTLVSPVGMLARIHKGLRWNLL